MCIKRVNGCYFATICRLCYTILAGNFCKGSFFTARFLRSIWQLYPRTIYFSTQVISVDSPRISCFSRNSPPHFQEVTFFRLTQTKRCTSHKFGWYNLWFLCAILEIHPKKFKPTKNYRKRFSWKRNYLRRTLDSWTHLRSRMNIEAMIIVSVLVFFIQNFLVNFRTWLFYCVI